MVNKIIDEQSIKKIKKGGCMKKIIISVISALALIVVSGCFVDSSPGSQKEDDGFIRFNIEGACTGEGECACLCNCGSLIDDYEGKVSGTCTGNGTGECTGDGPHGTGGSGEGNCDGNGTGECTGDGPHGTCGSGEGTCDGSGQCADGSCYTSVHASKECTGEGEGAQCRCRCRCRLHQHQCENN